MAYTKKQIKEAMDIIESTRPGLFVYASETKSGYHIYSIGQNEVQFTSQKEAQSVLMALAGKSSTPTGKRSYTPRTEAGIRRHLQAEEKKITKTYKNPVEPETHKVTIKRMSKNGKIYYVTKEVQNVSLESEFRKTQRAWTRAAKAYENASYEEQRGMQKISGRIHKSTFEKILQERGEEGARRYLSSMHAKASGYNVYAENQDLRDAADSVRRLAERLMRDDIQLINNMTLWNSAYLRIFNQGLIEYNTKKYLEERFYNVFIIPYRDYADSQKRKDERLTITDEKKVACQNALDQIAKITLDKLK